jgi:hypothetical protein
MVSGREGEERWFCGKGVLARCVGRRDVDLTWFAV